MVDENSRRQWISLIRHSRISTSTTPPSYCKVKYQKWLNLPKISSSQSPYNSLTSKLVRNTYRFLLQLAMSSFRSVLHPTHPRRPRGSQSRKGGTKVFKYLCPAFSPNPTGCLWVSKVAFHIDFVIFSSVIKWITNAPVPGSNYVKLIFLGKGSQYKNFRVQKCVGKKNKKNKTWNCIENFYG